MPPGRMTHRIDMSQSVAGYDGDGMIIITYDIPSGIQVNELIQLLGFSRKKGLKTPQ